LGEKHLSTCPVLNLSITITVLAIYRGKSAIQSGTLPKVAPLLEAKSIPPFNLERYYALLLLTLVAVKISAIQPGSVLSFAVRKNSVEIHNHEFRCYSNLL
jgi:hypothetical protein